MGLSRRMFTKEFRLVAVQRLERGSSRGMASNAGPKDAWRNWNARSASKPWRSVF